MTKLLLALSLLLAVISTTHGAGTSLRRKALEETTEEEENPMKTGGFINEEAYVAKLSEKLQPYELETIQDPKTNATTLHIHQFLHLHHMKTGGTSMDGLLNCAMRRLKKDVETPIQMAYMNIHECGLARYRKCRDGKDPRCSNSINEAAILSYCAPLMDLETFGWRRSPNTTSSQMMSHALPTTPDENAALGAQGERKQPKKSTGATNTYKPHAVTVFRHPVHRVWSMFRFQTKRCYSCRNLTDVYAAIDRGDTKDMDEICLQQLLNHQTRNLISTQFSDGAAFNEAEDKDALMEEAIDNMKNFFTLVGLTEDMNATAKMVGMVFPFMNATVTGSEEKCEMQHRNASPQNNRCGKDGRSHWDLPAHPDEATAQAILDHNPMDIILYEQAVLQFQYQKMALGLVDETDSNEMDEHGEEVPDQE